MILAAFLLLSLVGYAPAPLGVCLIQDAAQAPATQDSQNFPATNQAPSAAPQLPAQPPSDQAAPASKKPATHKRAKKKTASTKCPPTAGTGSPNPDSKDAPAKTPSNCPPSKIIVRQGGSPDPGIQLAPGAGGDQGAGERDRANQMLAAAEMNLKKLEGQALDSNQQETLKQIHQFMDQAKAAVAAGDFDRGRTLAWKAQLLSEELANPGK